MRKLALCLVVVSPLLLVFGMAGCAASIASIGNGSRQMTTLEAFALLGAPLLFISGIVLLVVDWCRRRRRASTGAQPGSEGLTPRESGGFAGTALSVSRIVAGAVLAAFGTGILGLAVNLLFLIWTAEALESTLKSDSVARYIAGLLAVLLVCMPAGYALLAWRESVKRRIGQALQPHEDTIMKAAGEIAIDYVRSRTSGESHAVTLTACIQRVSGLPDPVKAALAFVVRRSKLSKSLDVVAAGASCRGGDLSALVSPVIAMLRRKLDDMLFASRKRLLLYLFLANLCLFGALVGVTRCPLRGGMGSVAEFTGALLGSAVLLIIICVSKHPVAKDIRGFFMAIFKILKRVCAVIVMAVAGVCLVSRNRPQKVRWAGCCLIELVYGLVTFIAGAVLCEAFKGEQSHIIMPVACAVFVAPSLLLMRWIRRTGTAVSQDGRPARY